MAHFWSESKTTFANSAIPSIYCAAIALLITLAKQKKFYIGGQIITQLERDNLLYL